jgi:hypothetical protein
VKKLPSSGFLHSMGLASIIAGVILLALATLRRKL